MVAGEGIASPTGRDIDGKYLDQNEQDLKTRYVKFQKDWPLFGVTLSDEDECHQLFDILQWGHVVP